MDGFFEYMVVMYICITIMSLVKGYSKDVMLIFLVLATFVLGPLYVIGVMVDLRYLKVI
jgi:hypothetical protein